MVTFGAPTTTTFKRSSELCKLKEKISNIESKIQVITSQQQETKKIPATIINIKAESPLGPNKKKMSRTSRYGPLDAYRMQAEKETD